MVPVTPAPFEEPDRIISKTRISDENVSLVGRLYSEAYQAYRVQKYSEAQELLQDIL
jgi:hypothetical protein